MAFRAPRIVGGGQIIVPREQPGAFDYMNEERRWKEEEELKKKALELEAANLYQGLDISSQKIGGEDNPRYQAFGDWYQSPRSQEHPLSTITDRVGYGEGQWAPGKYALGAGAGVARKLGQGLNYLGGTAKEGISNIGYGEGKWAPGKYAYQGGKNLLGLLGNVGTNVGQRINTGAGNIRQGLGNVGRAAKEKWDEGVEGAQNIARNMKEFNLNQNIEAEKRKASHIPITGQAPLTTTRKFNSAAEEGKEFAKTIKPEDPKSVAKFQSIMGLEPTGKYDEDTDRVLRALQSGKYEKATSKNPQMQIIGQQEGGYSLAGGNVPGNETGDTNLAMLEDGEYVLNREAVKGMGKGFLDYVNNQAFPRFQGGGLYDEGFEDPGTAGGEARIISPDMETAHDIGKGAGESIGDAAKLMLGMQRGGYTKRPTGYQIGGFSAPGTYTGMLTNQELEQLQRNKEWESDIRRSGASYDYDVNEYQKDIDKAYKDAGVSWWNPLNMIPGVWDKEQYQEEAQRHKDEYAQEHMAEAFDPARVPEDVRLDETGYQLLKHHGGLPEASKDSRLSQDALKQRWIENLDREQYGANDWIEQWYGSPLIPQKRR